MLMKKVLFVLFFLPLIVNGQFAPPTGQPGSTAIYKDSSVFVSWATNCHVIRGWQNIADTSLGKATVGDSSMAVGPAGSNGVVSLGDGGTADLTFLYPIKNGPSWDFAVFENSFSDTFLELAFVEVSSDGINYFRFPSTSLTDTTIQVGPFDSLDATKINNLAGKYRLFYGTPFDLQELSGISGLDIDHITHVRLIDVVGSIDKRYATYDAFGHVINDPWPTPYNSSGFDLDAVGVIHQDMSSVNENLQPFDFNVFPNPVSKTFRVVSNKGEKISKASVISLNGEIIMETSPMASDFIMNISQLPEGFYLLKISGSDICGYKKIIKTN